MNEKIPLKRFAEKVASAAGITPEEAESDIKRLFALVAEELRTGQPVKIKGLGEFRLTSNPDDPVMFAPEAEWADEINAPFAMFEPVEVNPSVSTEELEAMETPEPSAATEAEAEVAVAVAPEIVTAAEEIPMAPTETPEQEVKPEEPAKEENDEEGELPTSAGADPIAPEPPAPVATPVPVAEPQAPIASQPAPSTPSAAQTQTPKSAPAVVLSPWPEEEEEEDENTAAAQTVSASTKSGFGRGFLVGLIIGLAIGALALCAYVIYYVSADGPTQTIETELAETEPLFAD